MTRAPADIDRELGENVRRVRESIGLSQASLAAKMQALGFDFQQQTIYKIESGNRKVTVGEATALATTMKLRDVGVLTRSSRGLAVTLRTYPVEKAYEDLEDVAMRLVQAQIDLARMLSQLPDETQFDEDQMEELRDALLLSPTKAITDVVPSAVRQLSEDNEITEDFRKILIEAWGADG